MAIFDFLKRKEKVYATPTVDMEERADKGFDNWNQFNPDDIARKRGGLRLYETMHNDDKLRGIHDFKAKATLSVDFEVIPASDNPLDVTIAEFVKKENIDKLDIIPFKDVLTNLYDTWYLGFKIAELNWAVRNSKVVVGNIKCKNSKQFDFKTDDFGNLDPNGVYQIPHNAYLPSDKFIIWTHPIIKDMNWYGESDYKAVFREWWAKDVMIKMRNYSAQAYGQPIRKVLMDVDKLTDDQRTGIRSVVDNLQDNLAIYIPAEFDKETKQWIPMVDISFLETARKTTEEYNSTIENLNTAMSRRLLVGDKLGYTDSQTGSYNSFKTSLDILWIVLSEIMGKTSDVMNAQLVKRIVLANWPNVTEFPKFKFHTVKDEITKDKMEIIKMGLDSGVIYAEEEWLRKYLNLPELTPEMKAIIDDAKAKKEAQAQAIAGKKQAGQGADFSDEEDKEDDMKARKHTHVHKEQSFVDTTNYKEIQRDFDATEKETVPELTTTFNEIRGDLISQARKIIEEGKPKFTLSIKSKHKSQIKEVFELAFLDTYMKAKKNAVEGIKKALKTSTYKVDCDFEKMESYKNIPVRIKGGSIGFIEKNYADKFTYQDRFLRDKNKQRAFYITGVTTDEILGKANAIITNGIGKLDVKTITQQLDDLFNPFLETGEVDGAVADPWRLNTIVRTNTTRIFNEARMSAYNDPELNNFVKAYQYSAVMDDRTTDYCEYHNGQVLKAGDPLLDAIPPAHYNCRSIWVPVFAGEDFEVTWKDKAGLELPKGFGFE